MTYRSVARILALIVLCACHEDQRTGAERAGSPSPSARDRDAGSDASDQPADGVDASKAEDAATTPPTPSRDAGASQRMDSTSSMQDAGMGDAHPPASMSPSSPADHWKPQIDPALAQRNYVILESQPGDSLGGGRRFAYDSQNSWMEVKASGNTLSVRVVGEEHWLGSFESSGASRELVAGYYGDLRRTQAMTSGFDWRKLIGNSFGGCESLTGWFAIDEIARAGDAITTLRLRFQITCSEASGSLYGAVQWLASDKTHPPDPLPVPENLWRAPSTSVPQGVNYAYFVSEPNDFVGQGGTYLYTQSIAFFELLPTSWQISLYIGAAKHSWTGAFAAHLREGRLVPGYYSIDGSLNPARGGVVVQRDAPAGVTNGWLALDHVAYEADRLTAFDLRFEQHCNDATDALRGEIHWRADDPSHLPTPIDPPPADLWRPAAGTTPSGLNYLYLQSEAGDEIGAGGTYTFTQVNSRLTVNHIPQSIKITAETGTLWSGDFSLSEYERIQPGYYGPRARGPDLPQLGFMTFSGLRACLYGSTWFAVDHVEYAADELTALDLRFEQHCSNASNPPLHGELRWRYDDPSRPPGPANPPPAALWRAPAEIVPAATSYVLLRSEPGEFVLNGESRDYTGGAVKADGPGRVLSVNAGDCMGTFLGMYQLESLAEGYYGGLGNYGSANPATGALSWQCSGRPCDDLTGWFVVDKIVYENGWIKMLDLRFEQICKLNTVSLHGQIHYEAL
jgi:hypothetical protein